MVASAVASQTATPTAVAGAGFARGTGERTSQTAMVAATALAVGVVALLVAIYMFHAYAGIATTVGPQGPAGPAGLPGRAGAPGVNGTRGVNGTNATWPTYYGFAATFQLNLTASSRYAPGSVSLVSQGCRADGNGLASCYLWFNWTDGPPGANATARVTALSYPPTDAFYYLGADPTLGNIYAPAYFQLWFGTTLAATGNVSAAITVVASVR